MDKNIAAAFRSVPSDARGSNSVNEGLHRRLIALNGCARSEASQLLHYRACATFLLFSFFSLNDECLLW